ncbi:MAG: LapA family protein [Oscillatoria sp. PMC 1051.18]|uniref:LapA family protein n=1 Tax=Oscillatoria salina TaxID=331517 RepID=UPI0013BB453B|nr:LapA family protein [Oscillatoria salina]MBZ8179132.1 LapA family protein [Oscillatoria salina IIICB1]MEC4893261.1 LapA family protein [Oscillatoria sp. PMC 1050.18]MEC5030041.1 LapA family protein [Oscillatoria sp. PMC 1051.18]NET86995.1 LapA family protein [Kamptonema sp. SIO1D9]
MRQVNFLIIFALCLALALFSIENTQASTINVLPGVEVEAPLSIELILAAGVGAVLGWLFSIWTKLQRYLVAAKQRRQVRAKEKEIEKLKKDLEQQDRQQFLPAAETIEGSEE